MSDPVTYDHSDRDPLPCECPLVRYPTHHSPPNMCRLLHKLGRPTNGLLSEAELAVVDNTSWTDL